MKACSESCGCTIFHEETLNEVKSVLKTDDDYQKISDFFKLFNDFTRIKILDAIKSHELCVCDLAYLLGVSKSAISHQMKKLKKHDLVQSKKVGKMVYYTLKKPKLKAFFEISFIEAGVYND